MAGLHYMGDIPFKDVYFTSTIRDMQGRRMSKSLGNSPDPLEVIEDYGADALRFSINYVAPLGQDVLFSIEKCEIGRNFANKIWNAGRFLLMNAQDVEMKEEYLEKHLDFTDKWIASRLQSTLTQLYKALDSYDINGATKILYRFVWNDFCDWYLELSKNRLYSDDKEIKAAVITRSIKLFEDMLKIVHPFMPFITEELWNLIAERKDGESISISSMPELDSSKIDKDAEDEIEFVQSVVTAIRNIRGEMNIAPSKEIKLILKTAKVSEVQEAYIKSLVKVSSIEVGEEITKPKAYASAVVKGCEIFIPLEGLIDLEVEKARLNKEIKRLEGMLIGVNKKLSNEKFVNNAPDEVVEKEKAKKADWENSLTKLKTILNEFG
jgi:valyl-tRNA synthetase